LLVESDPKKAEQLARLLTDGSYFVITTPSAEKALDRVWKAHPDMILISRQLEGMTALQFSAFLRGDKRLKRIPLVLLAEEMPTSELVSYFKSGIDDHIPDGMPAEEILARVRALLRRVYAGEDSEESFEHAGLTLRVDERRVMVDGRAVTLTRKEFELLKTLMSRPDKVIPSTQILSTVWGYGRDVSTKTLQVHVNRLRRKLGARGDVIRNFPGVGYAFSTEVARP
jgi:DNA-binding response OmpR family regulator